MDNGVNRLLTCHHDPNLAVAANANLFYKRLQIDHQVTIVTDVLTDFIHHKQQSEILALAVYIFLNVSYSWAMLSSFVSSPLNQFRAACSLMPSVDCRTETMSSSKNAKESRVSVQGAPLTFSKASRNCSSCLAFQ